MTADFEKDFIKWEKRFELGIPVIDAQHKRLVELCNDLYLTIVRNLSATSIGRCSPSGRKRFQMR